MPALDLNASMDDTSDDMTLQLGKRVSSRAAAAKANAVIAMKATAPPPPVAVPALSNNSPIPAILSMGMSGPILAGNT